MTPYAARKLRDEELDSYGITRIGKVRTDDQDAFLMATIYKHTEIHASSLTGDRAAMLPRYERLAVVSMVADGVGGVGGAEASATALEVALADMQHSMARYHRADATEDDFINERQKDAVTAHGAILAKRAAQLGSGTMATTQFANMLSSALGADNAMSVVTRLRSEWGYVHLLCSDGRTKHVSDAQVTERLRTMASAKQVCEQLLQDALDGGGTYNNITIVVGPAIPAASA